MLEKSAIYTPQVGEKGRRKYRQSSKEAYKRGKTSEFIRPTPKIHAPDTPASTKKTQSPCELKFHMDFASRKASAYR